MSISLRKTEPEKRNRKEKKIAKRFAILYPFSRIGRRSNEPFSVLLLPASYHGPRGMEPLQCTTGVNLASYYVRSLSHESLRRLYMAGENAEWKTFCMVLLRCLWCKYASDFQALLTHHILFSEALMRNVTNDMTLTLCFAGYNMWNSFPFLEVGWRMEDSEQTSFF